MRRFLLGALEFCAFRSYKLVFKNAFFLQVQGPLGPGARGFTRPVTLVCIGRAGGCWWVVLGESCQLCPRPRKVKLCQECSQRFRHQRIRTVNWNWWGFSALELCIHLSHQKDGLSLIAPRVACLLLDSGIQVLITTAVKRPIPNYYTLLGGDLAGCPAAFVEPGQRLQVTSSSPGTVGWPNSCIQDIKVLQPVSEELAVSSQTRNSRFEGERKKKKAKPVSVIQCCGASGVTYFSSPGCLLGRPS